MIDENTTNEARKRIAILSEAAMHAECIDVVPEYQGIANAVELLLQEIDKVELRANEKPFGAELTRGTTTLSEFNQRIETGLDPMRDMG